MQDELVGSGTKGRAVVIYLGKMKRYDGKPVVGCMLAILRRNT